MSRWLFALLLVVSAVTVARAAEPKISFQRQQLDGKFRSEGVAIGDFNHDGRPDVAAGAVWYAAPDWKMHLLGDEAKEYDPHGYSNCFCAWAEDLNGDGWADILEADFPGQETWWFENPGSAGGAWTRRAITPVTNNESPALVDCDGDGVRELVAAVSTSTAEADGPQRRMAIIARTADPTAPWSVRPISAAAAPGTTKYSHGLGVGDLNGDGRQDVLVRHGWWEAPALDSADLDRAREWTFHPADLGEDCAQMYVEDLDGDGDQDVISSAAHQLGLWWHEQTPDGWRHHEIDRTFSQTHALVKVDVNGDGLDDLVTGKRYWAHGPNGDVDPGGTVYLFWYERQRGADGQPKWIPHQIDHDSGVGTQFEVADIDGDGLLDVAVANKKGVNVFLQRRE